MKDPRETAWFLSRERLPAPGLQAASECVVPSPHFCYLWTEEAELRKSGTSRQDMDIEGLEFTPEQLPTFMLWAGSSNPHPSLAVGSFLLSWKPPLPTHPSCPFSRNSPWGFGEVGAWPWELASGAGWASPWQPCVWRTQSLSFPERSSRWTLT